MSPIPRLKDYRGPALLSYGFRPFFLLGALYAGFAILAWLPMLNGKLELSTAFSPFDWHVHEMVYGYLPAVVTGFLLTAIPNWTGRLPIQGMPLLILVGLTVADLLHGVLGTRVMQGALDAARRLSGNKLPRWSPTLPRAIYFRPSEPRKMANVERVVYFPSCAARIMGTQRGDDAEALPVVAERLFRKAGFDVVYPRQLAALCCGQPFESKGLVDTADRKSAELEAALSEASENGRWPIVFDTSPCAYRMRHFCGTRLPVHDSIEFIHDVVLSRLVVVPTREPVVIHPVCSVRKMGTVDQLAAIASRCSAEVVCVQDVLCCGFAGEKGFNRPELNEHALRHLKEALPPGCAHGYSSSRTCEIGLSEQAGFPYRSIIHLVEACASGKGAVRQCAVKS